MSPIEQSVNFSPFSVIFYDNLQVLMIDYELITRKIDVMIHTPNLSGTTLKSGINLPGFGV